MIQINKIYNENCLDTMKKMSNNFIDLIVTSPPYDNLRTYKGYSFDFESIAKELYRITKNGGVVVWIVADATKNFCESLTSFKQIIFLVDNCSFKLLDTMIWQKSNYAPMYPNVRRYDNNFEYMFILSKGKPKTFNPIKDIIKKESTKQRYKYEISYIQKDSSRVFKDKIKNKSDFSKRNNIWTIPNGQIRGLKHPAVFPEKLAEDHIITWSNEKDLVYDPFIGSGTTVKMAKINKRNYIGSEISKEYCNIAEKRINKYLLEKELF